MWHRCPSVSWLLIVCTIMIFPASAGWALPVITKTEIRQKGASEYIVFHTSETLHHQKVFMLQNPDRLVVDFDTNKGTGVYLPSDYRGSIVKSLRFGQFDADTSRIVIDLARPLKTASMHHFTATGNQPERVVLELVPLSGTVSTGDNGQQGSIYPIPILKPEQVAKEARKPIIVIDAGHGGKDPGAKGRGGYEKHITLDYARALRSELLRSGRYRVVLTREEDEFILLHDRVKLARKAKGDIFISLHADTAPGGKRTSGLSIYTLAEKASDEEAAALAEQENKSDIISGMDLSHENEEVAGILIELAQRETKNKSSELAETLVKQCKQSGVTLLRNTHRFAGFRVLKAPDIPSVLVEIGFISNPEEDRRIRTADYKSKVSKAILYGLDSYFKEKQASSGF